MPEPIRRAEATQLLLRLRPLEYMPKNLLTVGGGCSRMVTGSPIVEAIIDLLLMASRNHFYLGASIFNYFSMKIVLKRDFAIITN
jgi:hypothetical protein